MASDTTPERFPKGSRWLTFDGQVITATMFYETQPGCWRLCFDGPEGGGHMGQNHFDRLTRIPEVNVPPEVTAEEYWNGIAMECANIPIGAHANEDDAAVSKIQELTAKWVAFCTQRGFYDGFL